jgi:hypothetical protein
VSAEASRAVGHLGWVFSKLLLIRLRNSLSISEISIY